MSKSFWLIGAAIGMAMPCWAADVQTKSSAPAPKAAATKAKSTWFERLPANLRTTADCGPGSSQPTCTITVTGTPPPTGSSVCTITVAPTTMNVTGLNQQTSVTWNIVVTSGQMRLKPPATQFVISGNNPALDFDNPQLQNNDMTIVWTDLHKREKSFTYTFQVQYKDASGAWANCDMTDPRIINLG